ncbi:MAG: esterase-like activity of phytase family protein [Actinobacteria bacterium]|nr:esterase-like activity of phytase family protein [Actinomycetota bacterium]
MLARAILPATAEHVGPTSGKAISADNGVTPPFADQPVAGFSAILEAGGGEFWAMPDNGYGAKDKSAHFLLRLYRIRPRFRTARGGDGTIDVRDFVSLRDPDGRIPFALTRPDRLLTGADLDPESVFRANDGTFWFGDEFGPFLLHTDATGNVLAAPFALRGAQSPQNPSLATRDGWTIPDSRGFEAMASSTDGTRAYPMLEGAWRNDSDRHRRIIMEFDLRKERFTGRTWSYRTDADFPDALIGDMTSLGDQRFVLIERDDEQGAAARQKKIYAIDLRRRNADGHLVKRLVVDLLAIRDPHGISSPPRPGEFGVGSRFSFPLQSVESVEFLGEDRLLIANDNNLPSHDGRWTARDRPDDTELIIVHAPIAGSACGSDVQR